MNLLLKHCWRCRGLVSLRSRFDSGEEHQARGCGLNVRAHDRGPKNLQMSVRIRPPTPKIVYKYCRIEYNALLASNQRRLRKQPTENWGSSPNNEISTARCPKLESLHTSAEQSVSLDKPAHLRKEAFTDKTGGGNNEADCSGKNVDRRAWIQFGWTGNSGQWRVTGGADLTAKPSQSVGMRKGSALVQGVAPKSSCAV